jgi:hypothetical protein
MMSRFVLILLVTLPLHQALAQGDVCDPNPCTSPPAGECDEDGVTLLTYLPEGLCTDLGGGSFSCEYIPTSTDCSAEGKICSSLVMSRSLV